MDVKAMDTPEDGTKRPALAGEQLAALVQAADAMERQGNPTFRITLSDVGGPLRTLAGTAHNHIIGLGRNAGCEFGRVLVADPDYVSHQLQPCRFDVVVDGRLYTHLPDYWALRHDGGFEFGEIKIHPGQVEDDEYIRKMERVSEELRLLGCDFRIRYRREIVGTPARQINVAVLHYDRAANLSGVDWKALLALEGLDGLSFGDVRDEISNRDGSKSADAAARRLVTMGRIWIDIDLLLTDDSPARVRPISRHASPLVRH
jgi:hypothetical protein